MPSPASVSYCMPSDALHCSIVYSIMQTLPSQPRMCAEIHSVNVHTCAAASTRSPTNRKHSTTPVAGTAAHASAKRRQSAPAAKDACTYVRPGVTKVCLTDGIQVLDQLLLARAHGPMMMRGRLSREKLVRVGS